MPKVPLDRLRAFIYETLCAAGLQASDAEVVADVYFRATLRGVGHHDIYDLPSRLKALATGAAKPRPAIGLLHKFNALENYDGDNGLGELCSSFLMERAMRLADEFGIGFCAVRHSNHFLSAAPYLERATEAGYLGLIFSRTFPVMGAPGTAKRVIGNGPLGYAAPTGGDYPLMLDICLAYASYGKLEELIERGERVPAHWGYDAAGLPTTDPAAIKNGGSPTPIGEHKGFGLSMLVEILTAVLAEGPLIDEPSPYHTPDPRAGLHSQAAIVIRPEGFMGAGRFQERTADMLARLAAEDPAVQIPGRRSAQVRAAMLRDGAVELRADLVDRLNEWAGKLGMEPLVQA